MISFHTKNEGMFLIIKKLDGVGFVMQSIHKIACRSANEARCKKNQYRCLSIDLKLPNLAGSERRNEVAQVNPFC